MPEVTAECEAAGCDKHFTADSIANLLGFMKLHQENVHGNSSQKQKPPKVDRPKISRGISAEEWETFSRKWTTLKKATAIGMSELNSQLLACCDNELENCIYSNTGDIDALTEAQLLVSLKELSVDDISLSTRITELLHTRQAHGESVRPFVARLRGKAAICPFSVKCSDTDCAKDVSFSDSMVKWVLLAGMASSEISREIHGTPDIDDKTLSDTMALIDAKERAARAHTTDGAQAQVSAVSSYKKGATATAIQETKCVSCGKKTTKFGTNRRGLQVEFKYCTDCFKARRRKTRDPDPRRMGNAAAITDSAAVFGSIGGLSMEVRQGVVSTNCSSHHDSAPYDPPKPIPPPACNKTQGPKPDCLIESFSGAPTPAVVAGASQPLDEGLDNYVYDEAWGWHQGDNKPQPTIRLTAQIDHQAYHTLRRSAPVSRPAEVECVSDSGAQSPLAPPSVLQPMGLTARDLIPVKRRMKTAVEGEVNVTGAVFMQLSGCDENGERHCARTMVYISPDAGAFYLSRTAMEQLKIIPPSFPQVGAAAAVHDSKVSPCGCPTRTEPPGRPGQLPFPATAENTARMKDWLLSRYASSTFNRCPHQPLPTMTGPEMEIRVSETCTPSVTRRPVRVPTHWQERVKRDLDRDVALGVIERVPPGTPVTWLHNMVLSAKSDGSPRRTVDLQPLNKHSVRETHHTVPPAQQARAIPRHQIMTVTDAWNGYHAIPIKEEDRHKTTFITEQGRYRYCRAPMGFLASGDAYTHRYDMVVADVPRLAKVIDDSLLYDPKDDRESHWWRVIDYVARCGKNGIILNSDPTKFQFAEEAVDFTAFRLTGDEVKPLPKYLDSIRNFPRPTSITDIRAWFGLVNQVAHYGRLLDLMAPFKPLLSPKTRFEWSDNLEEAFQKSKLAIVEAIVEGVEIYDPKRTTCLQTDFSGAGIGYWLRQKYCDCADIQPDCCQNGWRITLVGSRFLRDAEKRYAAIEGECLAVAWALEDTRWFTLGCPSLTIATDHKPLIRILGDKSLESVQNPRIFRLKQRTLMWNFRMIYVAGKFNPAADAASRHPATVPTEQPDTLAIVRLEDSLHDGMEADVIATAQSLAEHCGAVTWYDLQHAQQSDAEMRLLHPLVARGFPDERDLLPAQLRQYWPYRDRLYAIDGVIMMDSRIVVPAELRASILKTLHAAHQGISGMQSRAQDSVFWPGITTDITRTRNACHTCASMAPSQPHMPPAPPITPEYPFQAIVGDYFELKGVKYLVIVDRFTGWPHMIRARYSSEAAGARGLQRCLRLVFATFGVPEEFSSDGGPEFVARETEAFFKQWGVSHRLASAYNPESNGRAEVGVKSMKRLLSGNVNADGSLDTDAVVTGLLQYRNTPEPTTGMSPAMILFGRRIRDRIPIPPGTSWFVNQRVAPVWKRTWQAREDALRTRYGKQLDARSHSTRDLGTLTPGGTVRLQNLCGNHPKKWDRTGQVTEQLPYDQYLVKMHGSGRVVRRNRRHLKSVITVPEPLYTPNTTTLQGRERRAPPLPAAGKTRDRANPAENNSDHGQHPGTQAQPETASQEVDTFPSFAPQDDQVNQAPDQADPQTPPSDPPMPTYTPPGPDSQPPQVAPPFQSPRPADPPAQKPRRSNAGTLPAKYKDCVVDMPKLTRH